MNCANGPHRGAGMENMRAPDLSAFNSVISVHLVCMIFQAYISHNPIENINPTIPGNRGVLDKIHDFNIKFHPGKGI